MDQTLDQVIKSRKLTFNKITGKKQFSNQNQKMGGQKMFFNRRQGFQQRPRGFVVGNFGGMKRTQFRRPGFQGTFQRNNFAFQQPRQNFMTMQRNFTPRRQFAAGFQGFQRNQGFIQKPFQQRQTFRNQQTGMPMRNFNNQRSFGGQQMQFKPQQQQMGTQNNQQTRLYISNLDFGVSNQDIKELFSEFGPIVRYGVNHSAIGRSVGTAEVIFQNKISAVKAVQKYNGVTLDGRAMQLEMSAGPTASQNQTQPQQQTRPFVNKVPTQQRLTPMRKQFVGPRKPMMMNKQFNKRPTNKLIAAAAVQKVKTRLFNAAIQKKGGGRIGLRKMPMKGKNAIPDATQLDADLEAYANSKD